MMPATNPSEKIADVIPLRPSTESAEKLSVDHEIKVLQVDTHDDINATTMDLTQAQKDIVKKFKRAQSMSDAVKILADLADKYHIEDIISTVPVLGDGVTNVFCGTLLLAAAFRAGLSWESIIKIPIYQGVDFAAGVTPGLGDALDFAITPNAWSSADFDKHTDAVYQEAIKAGLSDEELGKIKNSSSNLTSTFKTVAEAAMKAQAKASKKASSPASDLKEAA